jgi:3'(2'), 5'-bisphosphate nucleotidase
LPGDPIVAEEDTTDLEKPEHAALMATLLVALNHGGGEPWSRADMLRHIGSGGHGGGGAGRFWTLDPIDGTKGFLRGDQYAIALALLEAGRVVFGVLGCPRLELPESDAPGAPLRRGWLCVAAGGKAWAESLDGVARRSLAANPVTATADMVVCESVEAGHSAHGVSAQVAAALGSTRAPLRMDSQAKYAAVAAGLADAYLRLPTRGDYQEKIWDHAAGAFVLETAGGRVSDVRGVPLDFSRGRTLAANRGVLATAAGVHDAVVRAVVPHFPAA